MQVHEIPREYKGEGRILYIFSTKGLEAIYDVILRWIKFKRNGNRVYIYKDSEKALKEDTKDE